MGYPILALKPRMFQGALFWVARSLAFDQHCATREEELEFR
jgi:hypothetical protein